MKQIFLLFISLGCATGYAQDQALSLQIINNTTDKVFKHCRVSPSGIFVWPQKSVNYFFIDYLNDDGMEYKNISSIMKLFEMVNIRTTTRYDIPKVCGVKRNESCDGFSNDIYPLMKPSLSFSSIGTTSTIDEDNVLFSYELSMRYATAQYSFPNEVNYTGWSAYNVSITSGGGFVQGIYKMPPLLQIECDLYDENSDQYLTTFGFILRENQASPQFFNGGDTHLHAEGDYDPKFPKPLLSYTMSYL